MASALAPAGEPMSSSRAGLPYTVVKRAFDVAVGGTILLLSSPVLAVAATLVRVRLGRPVIYRQVRPGLGGRDFSIMKLRTMTDGRDGDGQLLPDRERLTRLGRFLRATSVDELPELVNVLKGEMSLVGPRPLLGRYVPHLTEQERRRMDVRPGITGYAQVAGRNELAWDERLALDVWYVDRRSLWLDLTILARTALRVLDRKGTVVDPTSTMRDLDEERS